MAAKIVNLADPDEGETLYASLEDAEQALAAMVERFKTHGARGETRTRTHLRETDFKSVASTSSATRACLKKLEARNGIEPMSAALQAAA